MLKVVNQFHIGKETSSVVPQSDSGLVACGCRPACSRHLEAGFSREMLLRSSSNHLRQSVEQFRGAGRLSLRLRSPPYVGWEQSTAPRLPNTRPGFWNSLLECSATHCLCWRCRISSRRQTSLAAAPSGPTTGAEPAGIATGIAPTKKQIGLRGRTAPHSSS